jgi:hypothetical protein
MATERYLVSAMEGSNLLLRIYKVEKNQITLVRKNTIYASGTFGFFNAAVMYRNENKSSVFDVYYGVCQDFDCVNAALAMKRFDSNLNLLFSQDKITGSDYWGSFLGLTTERVEKKSGTTFRILTGHNNSVVERILDQDGVPGNPILTAFRGEFLSATAAEDGKMIVASNFNKTIQSRTFHPAGAIQQIRISDDIFSLSLSGSMTSSRYLKPYRLLFYRVIRREGEGLITRIIMRRFDNGTAKSIGMSKIFTEFEPLRYYSFEKSVAVTPDAKVIFYTRYDSSCDALLLWGQVFNPQTFKKIGAPQRLIGCDSPAYRFDIGGIDVAQLD